MDYSNAINQLINEKKIHNQYVSDYITTWESWYKGKVQSFHRYYIYNGKKKIYREKASLKMAKQVCEDWASLLMNEKVKIAVSNQEELDKILNDLDFYTKANESIEKGFALSMSALVIDVKNLVMEETEKGEYVIKNKDNAHLILSLYNAKNIIPLTWENGVCTECGFVREDSDKTITLMHLLDEKGEYVIYTQVEYTNNASKNEAYQFFTKSKKPWFVIISPRVSNNLDIDSPYPISIFANSIDTLKSIDTKYDSYDVEFLQGKKRTYVSAKMTQINEQTGEAEPTFDTEDTVIYQLPENVGLNGEEKPMVVNVTDTLRTAEHSQAIQDELNFLSKQVGLGVDYYRFEKGRVMTATQVISEKSDTFRNMKKHEIPLEKNLITLMQAIMYASNNFTNIKFDRPDDVVIQFDDSIIEDKATEKDNDRKDLESGVMSKLEFRMKWYGEDEETARKALSLAYGDTELLSRMNQFMPMLQSGAITYLEYVKNVYPTLSESEQIEMASQLENQSSISADSLGGYTPPTENN